MYTIISAWHIFRRGLQLLATFLGFRLYEYLPPGTPRTLCHFLSFLVPTRWQANIQKQNLVLRTAQAFQKLGPVAIKFGQMLSTRHDLINAETAKALATLQDQMPYFPSALAKELITEAFGLPIESLFDRFDETPLAAASIAQIHTGSLSPNASPDGLPKEVIIKIIRPGVEQSILQETTVLKLIAKLANQLIPEVGRFHVLQVVEDYEATILAECDLRLEAANTQRFAADFKDSPLLYVPHIYTPWVRKTAFIMERVSGLPVNDIDGLVSAGVSLPKLSEIGATIFLTQVFKNNFFHADMHPGNILVDISDPEAPRYIALDCAIAGTLEARDHRLLTRKLLALIKQDYHRLARLLIAGRWVPADTHRNELAKALEVVCSPILSKPLSEIEFGPLLAELFSTARKFELQALPQFVLLEKTLLHVEGLGRQLDPNLDIWSLGQPLLSGWLRDDLLSTKTLCTAQNKMMSALEKMPEALEDWYDQQMGVRQSPEEAIGERLKRIELQLATNTQNRKYQWYATILAAIGAMTLTNNSLSELPPISILLIGAAIWCLKPAKAS